MKKTNKPRPLISARIYDVNGRKHFWAALLRAHEKEIGKSTRIQLDGQMFRVIEIACNSPLILNVIGCKASNDDTPLVVEKFEIRERRGGISRR